MYVGLEKKIHIEKIKLQGIQWNGKAKIEYPLESVSGASF